MIDVYIEKNRARFHLADDAAGDNFSKAERAADRKDSA